MTSMVSVMPNQVPEAILEVFFGVTKMMLYLGYGPFPVTVAFSAFTLSAARPLHCSMSTNVYIPQNGK